MADDIATNDGNKNNDSAYTASPLSPSNLANFEIECKTEPCSSSTNPTDEELLTFDEAALHIPVSIPTIKYPIVLLEKCDKIWETLQLIKTVQVDKPVTADIDDNKVDKEEKMEAVPNLKEEPSASTVNNIKSSLRVRNDKAVPFKFSVQRTKKLYPCDICGKQYLERRSLRKHSEREHGIILPLLIRRKRRNIIQLANKKNLNKVDPVSQQGNPERLNNDKNSHRKIPANVKVTSTSTAQSVLRQFVRCTLCQQKVISIRKHLIHYHKLGSSLSMVEQLESSLLIKNTESPSVKRNLLKDILPLPSRASVNENVEDGFRIMDNEGDAHGTSQVKRKRKYTLSYTNSKRHKLNKEHYESVQKHPATPRVQVPKLHKCDICLGMYSSSHSLYKHKRIHRFRGETKENFHKFKCRYHNSPFNKKYKLLQSSIKPSDINVNNTNNRMKRNSQLNNSKYETFDQNNTSNIRRTTRYNGRMDRNEETVCICGRSFRNPHTLFTHKKNCELCRYKDDMVQRATKHNNDRDIGNGISITIKKRNDSYEIVGKDDEGKPQKSEIYARENNSSISKMFHQVTKDSITASTKQQELNTSDSSNYSKDHSILKLQVADEDIIIDVEDDIQISIDKTDTAKRIVKQGDEKRNLSEQQVKGTKKAKDEKVFGKVSTLREMCQEILNVLVENKSRNAEKNESQKDNHIEDQEVCQENKRIESTEISRGNNRNLRSSNKRRRNTKQYKEDFNYMEDKIKVGTTKFDPFSVCGYCNKQFSTISSYNDHQCTVKEGRPFDEFSLQLLCFYCNDVLHSFSKYDEHVRLKHFIRGYHCYQCTERFKTYKARRHHFHAEHDNVACKFCNKTISISVKALHEGYHLGFGYPCHKCKKTYTHKRNLSYHNYTIHSDGADNLITCTICLKFIKLKTFRRHMSGHNHNACHFCGKVFANRIGLEYHTMIHHGTHAKLKCNTCGTRFFTKRQLDKHEKVDGCNNGMQQVKRRTVAIHAKNR